MGENPPALPNSVGLDADDVWACDHGIDRRGLAATLRDGEVGVRYFDDLDYLKTACSEYPQN